MDVPGARRERKQEGESDRHDAPHLYSTTSAGACLLGHDAYRSTHAKPREEGEDSVTDALRLHLPEFQGQSFRCLPQLRRGQLQIRGVRLQALLRKQ